LLRTIPEGIVRHLLSAFILLSVAVTACSKKTPTSPTDVVPPANNICTYSVSTSTFNIAGTGGSATFTVNTQTGCAWTVVSSSNSFATVTSATSQSGPGSVSFTVPQNPGDTRTATLTVAGQTVTITQAPDDAVYGAWGGTIAKGSGCPATLPASVDYTGTIRRTSGATNEFVISIPSLGLANQTLALTINGNSVQFFVPIDTLYTFNGTLSPDHRSINGTFAGGTCSGTWNGARR
jgi:hypothetical protein